MNFLRCLVNGRTDPRVEVSNRGLQYGDGLFETVAVWNDELILWDSHLDRLAAGATRLGLTPIDRALLTSEAKGLAVGAPHAILKVVLVRASGGRGYRGSSQETDRILSLWPWPPQRVPDDGMDVGWCETRLARQPRLAGLKHLNRLEQVLAQQELGDRFAEGLMRDTEGWVVEATMSNLFIGENGILVTPCLDHAGVAGVMRARVMVHARSMGIEVRVEQLSRERILAADELFLTNSLLGIGVVHTLPERGYYPGPLAKELTAILERHGDVAFP